MKPIFQKENSNDCFAACIASILELDIKNIPKLYKSNWPFIINEWLKPYDYFYADILGKHEELKDLWFEYCGWHIISGPGPRGVYHSVVAYKGSIRHDPYPGGLGIEINDKTEYGFLIPTNPSIISIPSICIK